VKVGKVGGGSKDREQLHRGLQFWIGHYRQIDQALDRAPIEGLPDRLVFGLDLFPGRVCRDFDVAQAGELFQGFLSGGGEPLQLPGHEIHHVVGIAPSADAFYVPLPSRRNWVEREQPLFGQRGKELDRKERIAAGLLLHQLG
jgi:hypothetical protein